MSSKNQKKAAKIEAANLPKTKLYIHVEADNTTSLDGNLSLKPITFEVDDFFMFIEYAEAQRKRAIEKLENFAKGIEVYVSKFPINESIERVVKLLESSVYSKQPMYIISEHGQIKMSYKTLYDSVALKLWFAKNIGMLVQDADQRSYAENIVDWHYYRMCKSSTMKSVDTDSAIATKYVGSQIAKTMKGLQTLTLIEAKESEIVKACDKVLSNPKLIAYKEAQKQLRDNKKLALAIETTKQSQKQLAAKVAAAKNA
jgi:hypothetical protein